jgi:hypothetical protein
MLPVGTSILRHAVLRAAHRPCGSRCSRLPLRVFGAARYRRSVFAARRQVQAVRGSSTRSPARESQSLCFGQQVGIEAELEDRRLRRLFPDGQTILA